MSSDTFAFKKFSIKQDKCAMKVGTDAVLLGAWVSPNGSKTILDIGTGTGVIALMLAQKSEALVTAIDIDKESTDQAKLNVNESIYSAKIDVKNISIQELAKTSLQKFDLIVTNPPYFIDSYKSTEATRTVARHSDSLPFEELIDAVTKLLDIKGKFCLILPKTEAGIFRKMAELKGLYLSKLLRIRTKPEKESEKRHLMQFEFKETEFSEATLVIEENESRNYTQDYKDFTKDYYINF
ncbi:MAG: methyltransferase [Bacteroidota bacterium]|nr:methyltransferase [Bacteroidota bacterium]MDP3146487.1 methyltransferase [Bacteroidota bacterium]MDP3557641.1 methyltransferase [Bacteroidota bacterium]